jgi:hypothetical protein
MTMARLKSTTKTLIRLGRRRNAPRGSLERRSAAKSVRYYRKQVGSRRYRKERIVDARKNYGY